MNSTEALKYLVDRLPGKNVSCRTEANGCILKVGRSSMVVFGNEVDDSRLRLFADGFDYSDMKAARKKEDKRRRLAALADRQMVRVFE